MNKYKVCVYAICKNEEKFVNRWMDSMSEADIIVVADTGSSDKTVELLKSRGAIVESITINPWRFDKARNASMDIIPDDVDICVCTDLDEIFEPGWRENLEKEWTPNATRAKYSYTWNFNEDGSPGTTFWYEKIHKRDNFKWIYPVHEVLEYSGTEPEFSVLCKNIQLNHYADPQKSRSSYLPLLELSAKENPANDRTLHYLGREYMFYQKWDECIDTLTKHLELPSSLWKDERSASMRFIARAYKEKKDYSNSKSWLYKAIAETPYLREPYVEMAKLSYLEEDWACVYHMVNDGLKIKERPLTYINEPFCWDYTIYDLGAISAYNLGLLDASLVFAKQALDMAPNNERLKNNFELIVSKIK